MDFKNCLHFTDVSFMDESVREGRDSNFDCAVADFLGGWLGKEPREKETEEEREQREQGKTDNH